MLTFHCNDFIILRPFVAMLALRCDILLALLQYLSKIMKGQLLRPKLSAS